MSELFYKIEDQLESCFGMLGYCLPIEILNAYLNWCINTQLSSRYLYFKPVTPYGGLTKDNAVSLTIL